ncbi:hypothetical protein IAU60_001040 [Kwoniella sp. DSM 27419]
MDRPIASSSRQATPSVSDQEEPYARLSFEPASQSQILRSHQRDAAQIFRLTDLVSELLRSIAGTRWLAHKQLFVDLAVKALYLGLTLGRGAQTLGEEYTDILPQYARSRRRPSKARRLATIGLLLLPSLLLSPATTAYLRSHASSDTRLDRAKRRLLALLESPLGKMLPELHMIAFLFSGRFFAFARRLTGLSYISTLPARPPERRPESYEPLGLLMLIPLVSRLLPRRGPGQESSVDENGHTASTSESRSADHEKLDPLPAGAPPTAQETLLMSKSQTYDTPNTYLSPDAQDLPERQCTLCLEPRGTGEGSGGSVAVTECGHVFCWGCLGGLEKLECPLCRQALRMERLVAAYNL